MTHLENWRSPVRIPVVAAHCTADLYEDISSRACLMTVCFWYHQSVGQDVHSPQGDGTELGMCPYIPLLYQMYKCSINMYVLIANKLLIIYYYYKNVNLHKYMFFGPFKNICFKENVTIMSKLEEESTTNKYKALWN